MQLFVKLLLLICISVFICCKFWYIIIEKLKMDTDVKVLTIMAQTMAASSILSILFCAVYLIYW